MSEIQKTKKVIIAALDAGRLSKIGKISLLNQIIGDIQRDDDDDKRI